MIVRAVFLISLISVLAFWYVVENRDNISKMAKQAIAWALIFVGVIAAIGLWQDAQPLLGQREEAGIIEVPRHNDGHFHLVIAVNEVDVEFLVDTGATGIVLSTADARRVGIDPIGLNYAGRAQTANGVVRTAPVLLDEMRIGSVVDQNVRALVNEGEMFGSLLGMDYLERFAGVTMTADRLILER